MSSEQISDAAYFNAAAQVEDAILVRRVKGDGHNDAFVPMREVYVFQADAVDAQAELDRTEHITDAEIESIKRVLDKNCIGYDYNKNLPRELAEATRKAKPR